MSDTVEFTKAQVGDEAYTYSIYDGDLICGEFGWVTDLEYFDERFGDVRLKRQRWRLVGEDELVLPDPYAIAEDEVSSS
jgi:hypothetical protein